VALSYQAVAIFGDSSTDCSASATTPTCTITGLEPGTTYTVVGYALGARGRSDASSPTTAIAGTPTAAPPKPRIDSTKVTPGRRIAFAVSRLDTADWTTSFIVCTAGDSTVRKDVVDGRAVLSLRRGETYRCYAKSTNEVGAQRSKPVKVQV
jgi:hypothetical protein